MTHFSHPAARMTSRPSRSLFVLLGAVALAMAPSRLARADDNACFAASETEIGLRKAGKLQDAIKQLTICADPKCPTEVSTECGRRIQVLNAAIPTVILAANDGKGNDITAVTVTLDGAPLTQKLDGLAIAIDPGSHTLHFESAGNPPVDKTILVQEGEKDRQIVVSLGAPGAAPAPAAGGGWSTQKTLALVAAGVGVVGLGVGIGTGVVASSDASTSNNDCTATACSATMHASALSEHSTASTMGDVSTAMFVVGGVGIATGAVLWFTAPKGNEKSAATALSFHGITLDPLVSPRLGAMSLSGRF
jgi:hypothetical protein